MPSSGKLRSQFNGRRIVAKPSAIPYVSFSAEAGRLVRIRGRLKSDPRPQLEAARRQGFPSVLVVRVADLARLRPCSGLVEDRGSKHPRRRLSSYLLGAKVVPIIDGNYSVANQVTNGVHALLRQARQHGEENVYVVGVAPELFRILRRRVVSRAGPNPPDDPLDPPISEVDVFSERMQQRLRRVAVPKEFRHAYVGESDEADSTRRYAMLAAAIDSPALILGETGTGKEVLARQIHQHSGAVGRFVPVNCGLVHRDSFEAELFGRAPLGAGWPSTPQDGLWQSASRGTLFFDEVGDLSVLAQAQVLDAMKRGRVRPVGSRSEVDVSARIIATSSRDLYAASQNGGFSYELYSLLSLFVVTTSPLRDHPEDIPLLAQVFWRQIRGKNAMLPREVQDELQFYRWPGNARALKTVLANFSALVGNTEPDSDLLQSMLLRQNQLLAMASAGESDNLTTAQLQECAQHLERVLQVLGAFETCVRPVLAGRPLDAASRAAIRQNALGHYMELSRLCARRQLFLENTYHLVERTRAKLSQFQRRLARFDESIARFWKNEVAVKLGQVRPAIFRAIRRRDPAA